MNRFVMISSCIAFVSIVNTTMAQNQLGVNDFAAQAGLRGYTNYNQSRDNDRLQAREDNFPTAHFSLDQKLYEEKSKTIFTKDGYTGDLKSLDSVSKIEKFYRERTGNDDLKQYGYDLFHHAIKSHEGGLDDTTKPMGAVQDDYILQAGDEVIINFSGEKRSRENYRVGRDGRLIIDQFPSLSVGGKSLSDVRRDLNQMITNQNYRGDMEVSLASISQIGVLVAGHVQTPGRHNMNAFHSVIDALIKANGIRKTGSLRNIKLIRNGNVQYIDLYNFIEFGYFNNPIMLRDGDRIIVPPLGKTFAVTGDVKQDGVFEFKSSTMPMNKAIQGAGNILGGGDYLYNIQHGNGAATNSTLLTGEPIYDGTIINVVRATDRLNNAIELKGYSRQNGIYDLSMAPTLAKLFDNNRIFGDDTYPLMGVVSRIDRGNLTRTLLPFSPQSVAQIADDISLIAGDIVYLFSYSDIDNILEVNDKISNENKDKNEFPKVVRQLILDHVITIQGAVRNEGKWPVGGESDLETLISVAGGLTSKASRTNIEITTRHSDLGHGYVRQKLAAKDLRMAEVALKPGDQVRVNERFEQAVEKTVRISGEVKYAGSYDLMRGDTLSSLIERAGGITPDAYPPAAVFSRKAERKREEQKFRAAAQELERTVSINLNAVDRDASLTPAQISMARQLADDLRSVQAVGRVTVEADPAVLSVRPELDMLLNDGDHLHIPKRSLNVRVSGEVMNPASLLFTDEKDVKDYIREAGGKSYYADSDRIFVVYPDGAAQPLRGSRWHSDHPTMVIPGSTIIVPRDPKPFSFIDSFKDITQILTNMAITGVFIEDIATDEN